MGAPGLPVVTLDTIRTMGKGGSSGRTRLAAGHAPDAGAAGGHRVPLDQLLRDPDRRYRPVAALARAVEGNLYSLAELDRPVVPLLNALWRLGIRTQFSCADGALTALGADTRALQALWTATAAHAGTRDLEVEVSRDDLVPGEMERVTLYWKAPPDLAAQERALLEAADALRAVQLPARGVPSPEVLLGREVCGLVEAIFARPGGTDELPVANAEWWSRKTKQESRAGSRLAWLRVQVGEVEPKARKSLVPGPRYLRVNAANAWTWWVSAPTLAELEVRVSAALPRG